MDFGLYIIITNPVLPYTKIAEICVKQKVKYLQLREKDKNDRELLAIARNIVSITKRTETKFIINDRVDICLVVDADGVHLGQEDLSINEVRKILPNDKIIGVSTHNYSQAKEAFEQNPDYIGFGPIFSTPTKKKPDPVVGCNALSETLNKISLQTFREIPIVAIGGINETNIKEVLQTGVRNICMVRHFMKKTELEIEIVKIKEVIKLYTYIKSIPNKRRI